MTTSKWDVRCESDRVILTMYGNSLTTSLQIPANLPDKMPHTSLRK